MRNIFLLVWFGLISITSQAQINNSGIFRGSEGDGYASITFLEPSPTINNAGIFRGGPADGYSSVFYTEPSIVINNSIFYGGAGDGFTFVQTDLIPLPISLLSFNAKINKNTVEINWETASEKNNDFFTLSKSKDGTSFKPIAKVKGAGNSNEPRSYSHQDYSPFIGTSYYRLTQTDYDGNITNFNPIAVHFFEDGQALLLYPNPTDGILYIKPAVKGVETLRISIIDISGKEVLSQAANLQNQAIFQLNLKTLTKGMYLAHIQLGDRLFTKRILIK